jgi:hypothetical protein
LLILIGALLLLASAAPCIPAEPEFNGALSTRAPTARADGAPPWAIGCTWTWTADQPVDFCITVVFTIKINHVTGTITDELMETTVYNNTPVFRVEGDYVESLKGVVIMAPLPPQSVTIPIVGNTTVYYRIPDLAPVRTVGHFNIDMGTLGSALFDSITDYNPPLEEYRFPLDPGKGWKAGSDITSWNKMTSSSGGYETTTYQRLDCDVKTATALEDIPLAQHIAVRNGSVGRQQPGVQQLVFLFPGGHQPAGAPRGAPQWTDGPVRSFLILSQPRPIGGLAGRRSHLSGGHGGHA